MYIRSEKRAWNIEGTYLVPGASMRASQALLNKYKRLIESGDIAVFERDPNAKKAAPKPKAAEAPKPVEAAAEEKPKPAKRKRSSRKKKVENGE